MKSVLIIGMGKFGQLLGENLVDMGDEVMIVDRDESTINTLAPKYSGALIANGTNADNLKGLDIPSFDVCVVSIGEDFQSSLEITSILKDLNAKYVVSRADTDIQRKLPQPRHSRKACNEAEQRKDLRLFRNRRRILHFRACRSSPMVRAKHFGSQSEKFGNEHSYD